MVAFHRFHAGQKSSDRTAGRPPRYCWHGFSAIFLQSPDVGPQLRNGTCVTDLGYENDIKVKFALQGNCLPAGVVAPHHVTVIIMMICNTSLMQLRAFVKRRGWLSVLRRPRCLYCLRACLALVIWFVVVYMFDGIAQMQQHAGLNLTFGKLRRYMWGAWARLKQQ